MYDELIRRSVPARILCPPASESLERIRLWEHIYREKRDHYRIKIADRILHPMVRDLIDDDVLLPQSYHIEWQD
jgi:hypothetical protein